jgi:flagellar hook-length control protein FliK
VCSHPACNLLPAPQTFHTIYARALLPGRAPPQATPGEASAAPAATAAAGGAGARAGPTEPASGPSSVATAAASVTLSAGTAGRGAELPAAAGSWAAAAAGAAGGAATPGKAGKAGRAGTAAAGLAARGDEGGDSALDGWAGGVATVQAAAASERGARTASPARRVRPQTQADGPGSAGPGGLASPAPAAVVVGYEPLGELEGARWGTRWSRPGRRSSWRCRRVQ